MVELSKSQELFSFFRNEYIDNGYLYSGSWPINSLLEKGFTFEAIEELITQGVLQTRNCEGLAYELSPLKRHQLLSEHSLCSRWVEEAGNGFLEEIRAEVQDVSLVKQCVHNADLFTVDTLKNQGEESKPDKMDVSCPFSVGQVIQVEYDLPKRMVRLGYSYSHLQPGSKSVGEFMVTDIMCNLLVDPPVNMIELQSLSEHFNRIHPDARTMLLFEDIVLKRLSRDKVPLEEQIAEIHNNKSQNVTARARVQEQER